MYAHREAQAHTTHVYSLKTKCCRRLVSGYIYILTDTITYVHTYHIISMAHTFANIHIQRKNEFKPEKFLQNKKKKNNNKKYSSFFFKRLQYC